MLKKELLSYLQDSIDKEGDGEIKVEITDCLTWEGRVHEVTDLVMVYGGDTDECRILCFVEEED